MPQLHQDVPSKSGFRYATLYDVFESFPDNLSLSARFSGTGAEDPVSIEIIAVELLGGAGSSAA